MSEEMPVGTKPRVAELSFNVSAYVQKRAAQIADLLTVVDNSKLVVGEVTKGPRTAAQRLPRHMRRRAMSHDVRRMPHRLRVFAASFIASSKHRKKPPSRFARRRPRNLLLNYVRRQRLFAWLETHIWHAKRFRMVNRWNYRLPDRCYQRNFRPIYRASRNGCVIRDKSYLTCFMITAPSQEDLISRLLPLCPLRTASSSFAFRSALDGSLEVSTLLYNPGSYPHGFIGPARFLWSRAENKGACLTLWVHPSCRDELLITLQKLLLLEKNDPEDEEDDSEDLERLTTVEKWRIKRQGIRTDIWEGQGGVQLTDLRDQLVRFRLCGSKSMKVLSRSLFLAPEEGERGNAYREHHREWREVFSKSKAEELADGRVFSLLIEDPRCVSRFRKAEKEANTPSECVKLDVDSLARRIPEAEFWSREIRVEALERRMSNSEWCKRNGEKLAGVTRTEAKIPVLIVTRNKGAESHGLSGVDVIAPCGFGKDLWVGLQMRTAKASGLSDEGAAHVEGNRVMFPEDAADTIAGANEQKRQQNEREASYSRKPGNRRPAYWRRLSVKFPHSFEWVELVKNWKTRVHEGESRMHVIRDRLLLRQLEEYMQGRSDEMPLIEGCSLVAVSLESIARGSPNRYGLICLPSPSDLSGIREGKKEGKRKEIVQSRRGERRAAEKNGESTGSKVEPSTKTVESVDKKSWQDQMWQGKVSLDVASREKVVCMQNWFPTTVTNRAEKRKILNKKKKDRSKRRKDEVHLEAAKAEAEAEDEEAVDYRHSADRETIGRVVRGGFCFSAARGRGLGLIATTALPAIRSAAKGYGNGTVLFRNVKSKYYHPAKIHILQNNFEL